MARCALGFDAAGDEPLELGAAIVEDAECGVARSRDPPGHVEQLADDPLDVELGDQPATGLDELPQAGGVERGRRRSERGLGLVAGQLRHRGLLKPEHGADGLQRSVEPTSRHP